MVIEAKDLDHRAINEALRRSGAEATITGCLGQRFICAGTSDKTVTIDGIPGNALGAYLNGGLITVNGNAQDAVGDTMNAGSIVVHGNIGDAAGYAMRGGEIFVRGNAGYRAGVHMKQYEEKIPLIVIGGCAGSFLGEYQAGGVIVVLGLGAKDGRIVGNFPCTGMHGGKVILRSDCRDVKFHSSVSVRPANVDDLSEIEGYAKRYCELFGGDENEILDAPFTVIEPDGNNPYKRLYVAN